MRQRLIELLKTPHKAEKLRQTGTAIGDYEDDCIEAMIADFLLANGVIVPPCKVGDTVWIVGEHRGVYYANVRVFFFNEKNIEMVRTTKCDIPFSEFGKTFFLSRAEAEKELERRSSDD